MLAPAGIEVVWKSLASRKAGENFDLVAVGSFEGSCASDEAGREEITRSLADTSIADGHILPFFRIDCTRLAGMLGAQLEPAVLGRALARLAGHEIYQIVAQTTEHREKGLAKPSFSIPDLTVTEFGLDPVSLTRMRNAFSAQSPEIASRKSGESAVLHRK